jgi:histidyl-tRNA synthetase
MIPRVKGTQDFLDLTLYNYVLEVAKKYLTLHHFTEIATPIIEYTSLFQRSLGEQTDVVSKEMFILESRDTEDPSVSAKASSDTSMCLRPELTAPTVRVFVENHIQTLPWKVFSHGPMFRYERPQKGRFRQFHQLDLEVIGSASVCQDVHVITMLDRLFHEGFGMNNYALLINYIGTREDRARYQQKLGAFLDTIADKLCKTCAERREKNMLRIFDCKNPSCQELYEKAPHITDHLSAESRAEWERLQEQLSALSISFSHDPKLVRGLDYYNKTVFEFVSGNLGAQNTFCGGGRYDHLAHELGAKEDAPSIGAAIGIERLMLLLEPMRESLPIPALPALHIVMPYSEKQYTLALLIADTLLAAGLCAEPYLEGDSMKSMMRKANKAGARYCIIIGDDEQQAHQVTIKNMMTGEDVRVPQKDMVATLKR